jgi:peptidoglycan/xylan/chitin deacetylase (PgdA/CDA1 family)
MKVILTFDDGPSKRFGELLDYLIKNNQRAIFFCIGKNLEKAQNKKLIIKAIRNGFLIGNHSYSHHSFNRISFNKARMEITKTDKIIEDLYKIAGIKRKVKLFRFPSFRDGLFNKQKIQKLLKDLGYINPYHENKLFQRITCQRKHYVYHLTQRFHRGRYDVYCNIDPADWDKRTTFELALKVIGKAEKGDIVDLHDLEYNLDLVKNILKYLKA